MVISGSATRRSSFAFGSVVLISSCLNNDAAMLRNIASRCALVRLNLRPDFWWRMVLIPGVMVKRLRFAVAFLALKHGLRMALGRPSWTTGTAGVQAHRCG